VDPGPSQAIAIDLDLDGDRDVLLASPIGSTRAFLAVAGSLGPSLDLGFPGGGRAVVGDLDLDGDPDLLRLGGPPACIRVARNRWAERGEVAFAPASLFPTDTCPSGIPLLLDWDRDGDLDLLVAGSSPGSWRLFRNETIPSGYLTFVNLTSSPGGGLPLLPGVADAAVGDFDGDRYPDVVAVGPSGSVLLHNLAGSQPVDEATLRGLLPEPAGAVAASDLDLDGRDDALVLAGGRVRLYLSGGPSGFLEIGSESGLDPPAEPAGIVVADLSFDGFPDVVITSRSPRQSPRTFLSQADLGRLRFQAGDTPPVLASAAPGARLSAALDPRRLELTLAVATPASAVAHLASAPDADCDGLPDPFETRFGLERSDPNDLELDPDADHLPNFVEYRCGLFPSTGTTQEIGPDEAVAALRLDLDGDGVDQSSDDCQTIANRAQEDLDQDGLGDLCDASPDGTLDIGRTLPVKEYARPGGPPDHRYLGDRNQIRGKARELQGYFYQGSEFRWFPHAANGLEPVYERKEGRFYQYFPASELPAGEASVVGYASSRSAIAGLSGLLPLRRFVLGCGAQILTVSTRRAVILLRAGFREIAPLGFVPANAGERRLVPVAELTAQAGEGTPRFFYTPFADSESGMAGYVSLGERFRIFEFPLPQTVPLYRLTHPGTLDQLLTLDRGERASALRDGYRDEGILGFVLPHPPPSSPETVLALQRLRGTAGGHVYTTDRERFEELVAAGYIPEGTEGWVVELPPVPGRAGSGRCIPDPGSVPAQDGARRVVSFLREIGDPRQRSVTATAVLNGLCSLQRAATGAADPEVSVERQMAESLAGADPETRRRMVETGGQLDRITPAERAELLGSLSLYDPGACDQVPTLFSDFVAHVEGAANARLRTHFCVNTQTPYPGSTDPLLDNAARAVTVGVEVITTGTTTGTVRRGTSLARPFILGFDDADPSNAVTGSAEIEADFRAHRQPADDREWRGDGFYPYGIETGESCAADPGACERTEGKICGSLLGSSYRADRCYAFPLVERGKPFYVKGYNFWDPDDARLRLVPVAGGPPLDMPLENIPPQVKGVNPGESPLDADAPLVCQPPSPTVAGVPNSENNAAFKVPVSAPQGFYRASMYNHNGRYLLHGESGHGSIPIQRRTLHVCHRGPDDIVALPVDAGGRQIPACGEGVSGLCVNVDCIPPKDDPLTPGIDERSCPLDGDRCLSGVWGMPPRPLSQCLVNSTDLETTPVCPETPEWLGSQPIRSDVGDLLFPIVFVSDPPLFEIQALLSRVTCKEESGWDIFGEDETSVVLLAISETMAGQGLNSGLVQDLGQTWNGDFDSGDSKTVSPPKVLGQVAKLGPDEHVSFGLHLIERDSKPWIIAIGSVVIAVVIPAAIAAACLLGLAPACVLLEPAILIAIDALAIAVFSAIVLASDVNDDMGATFFGGTPRELGLRITAVHEPDFPDNPVYQETPGPLARSPFPEDDGTVKTSLRQPRDLAGTAFTGFSEEIDIEHGGGDSHYSIELLFQRLRCVEPPATPSSPLETICPSPAPG
jgi:hypothetical protein